MMKLTKDTENTSQGAPAILAQSLEDHLQRILWPILIEPIPTSESIFLDNND